MRVILAMAAGAALAACGGSPEEVTPTETVDAPAPAAAETVENTEIEISATSAFVMAPIAGRDVTMGGLNMTVSGGAAKLVSAGASFAETVELHTIVTEDGVMKMRMVETFDIADGNTLTLERGGNHLMFFGLEELVPGEDETLSLTFELGDGETETVEIAAEVRTLGE